MRHRRPPRGALSALLGLPVILSPLLVPTAAAAASTTLVATADAYVSSTDKAASRTNFGASTELRTTATGNVRTYLHFTIPTGIGTISGASLRLLATTGGSAFTVSRTGSNWSETSITGRSAPAVGAAIATSGAATGGSWSTVNVTSAVPASGGVDFVLTGPSGPAVSYSSRETGAATAPQLVLTTAPPPSSSPSPSASASPSSSATPTSGPTPTPTTAPSPSLTSAPSPSASSAPPASSSYADAVRADSPLAYYRLGDAGPSAADSSGAGRTGSYSGGVTHPTGAVAGDSAAGFDGTSGKVAVPSDTALRLNGSFTIEFWGRLDAFVNSYPGVLVKGLSSGPDGYLIWYTSTGQLNFKRNNISIGTPTGTLTSAWRHFAVTYDGTTLRWYADGSQVVSSARAYPASAGTAPLEIGRGDDFGRQSLDEVALYDRALTAAQLTAHRAAASSTSPSSSPSASASPTPTRTASPTPSPSPTFVGPLPPAPVIAAAGDIACDPSDANYNGGAGTASFCRQRDTAALLDAGGYSAVLPLGDEQYTDATLAKLQQVYDPTWGRTKSLHRPAVGNHEYLVDGAAGYFDYYGSQAGTRGKGWYSYDVGSWHLIALNGEAEGCPHVSCSAGSEQETWLRADLAAHPAQCTLAYWHVPKFSSTAPDNAPLFQTFWNDLYAAGVDVVLNGHFHNYERFGPQNASAAADPNGIREFVVGTGGKGLVGFGSSPVANSQVRNSDTYGVLELTLRQGSYDWNFKPIAGQTFSDTGSASCH